MILASIIGKFVFLRFIVDKIGIWAEINIRSLPLRIINFDYDVFTLV